MNGSVRTVRGDSRGEGRPRTESEGKRKMEEMEEGRCNERESEEKQ